MPIGPDLADRIAYRPHFGVYACVSIAAVVLQEGTSETERLRPAADAAQPSTAPDSGHIKLTGPNGNSLSPAAATARLEAVPPTVIPSSLAKVSQIWQAPTKLLPPSFCCSVLCSLLGVPCEGPIRMEC